ncbi:MAG TPA: M20/M25/M40 family metallo-hydrolase [Pirellulales bacterium]|nr:M20/M25/M40 family metallo-hydrolase [Pirellulales bacterium]
MPTQAKPTLTKNKKTPRRANVVAQSKTSPTNSLPRVDEKRALRMVMELMAVPGTSGHEAAVAQYITSKLRAAGAAASAIRTDNAHKKTPLPGEVGNLIFQMPGTLRAPRRLLMAHMDTVPVCVGSRPVRKGDVVRSANPATGCGADDRSGVAVVLNAALEILEHKLPHPPLTFFFPIQEEVGLHGARYVHIGLLGKPRLAFNWDGSVAEKITTAATGGYRLTIDIEGLAAHAGAAPEQGISAVAIASLAIAQLVREGWHGLIEKGTHRGTSNMGYIHGGEATNVVTDHVQLRAEARSHDQAFRQTIVNTIEAAFRAAAAEVRNIHGKCGQVRFHGRNDYEAFRLPDDDPSVLAAEEAVRAVGLEPQRATSNGGLDANWMTAHGIPTVTLGCGQMQIHTTSEFLDITAFRRACQIALRLATAQ